ncbi:MAG: hypothetical protein AB7E80_15525 [Hyphomicrobiaceae bacterium]
MAAHLLSRDGRMDGGHFSTGPFNRLAEWVSGFVRASGDAMAALDVYKRELAKGHGYEAALSRSFEVIAGRAR